MYQLFKRDLSGINIVIPEDFEFSQLQRLFVVLIKATIGFDHLKQNTITQFASNGFSIITRLFKRKICNRNLKCGRMIFNN
jgi:hypothetical protein